MARSDDMEYNDNDEAETCCVFHMSDGNRYVFKHMVCIFKNNHTTTKYPTHVRFVSINSRRFQNTYSSEDDHVLSEPDNESQHTGAVGLSHNIVTDVLRKSHPVITEELTKTHPINSTELTQSHPINSAKLTQSHPINSAELTQSHPTNIDELTQSHPVNSAGLKQSHPTNSVKVTQSHPINSAELTQSHPINSTDLTKSHSMIAEVLTKKHISANGWHIRPHTCTNCFRHDFVYLIQNEDICRETNKDAVDLIILIMTRHNNIYRRNVIRATWASISRNNTGNVRYVFLLGEVPRYELMENVKLEALHYKDMLMEDFRDSYHNLTYKTIMGLKWASSFCDNARFVLKTDDDMWVNVPQILRLVNRNQLSLQSSVLGRCGRGQVMRDKRSKGYITYNEYPLPYYPKYCSGSGYVTSMAVAKRIYNISRHVPFLKFEDAYFGLCIEALGNVRVRNQGEFFYMGDFRKDLCFYKSEFVLTCHRVPVPFFKKVMQAEC